ncbi:MAG: EAL domain-containing protein [Burkholderiaceae bacterium]|nr:EAL domain-containing protein [Burkholderiaceae bacterium]
MLAVATLAPIALLALLTDLQVSSALASQRDDELGRQARHYGLTLFERLGHVDDVLAGARSDLRGTLPLAQLASRSALASHDDALLGLARVDGSGRLLDATGRVPALEERIAALSATARSALDEGRSAILPPLQPREPVVMLMPLETNATGARFAAAAVRPTYLWGDAELAPPMTTFCVLAGPQPLDCAARVPDALPVAEVAAGRRTGLAWTVDDEAQRAGAWTVLIGSRFAGENWTVFAVQPAAAALAPTQDFRATYIPVAVGSLLVVLMLAMRQVRHISEPIRELLRGTQRLARRDFSSPVQVAGSDEFGQLASAFNTMASRLALQFGTLQAMAKIDRAILNSVDLSDVALNSIRCLRHIVETDLISVGLIHPEAPTQLQVQTRRRGARGIEKLTLDWPEAARLAENETPPLPPEYRRHLGPRQSGDLRGDLRVLPIARGGSFWGVVVLGDEAGAAIDTDRAAMLSGVVDRLAVALSTAARDWRLHVQAHYDPLTGLPNRMHLLTMTAWRMHYRARARREPHRGAVLFLDLDHFKHINDTLGHAPATSCCRRRRRCALRGPPCATSDTVARLGGDEFTVRAADDQVGARSRPSVARPSMLERSSRPFDIAGHEVVDLASDRHHASIPTTATTSSCCSSTPTPRCTTPRNRAGTPTSSSRGAMNAARQRAAHRSRRDLRQALERGEFALHYQPKVRLRRPAASSGVEALLRWRHPELGLVLPGDFIPIAEETGLIVPIGEWVLREACAQAPRWHEAGLNATTISVNLSPRQLLRGEPGEQVRAALRRLPRAAAPARARAHREHGDARRARSLATR